MKTLSRQYMLTAVAVLAVLVFAGIGCTRTDETLPEGETTTDLPAETLPANNDVATDDLTTTSSDSNSSGTFTVDLLPEDDSATADTADADDAATTPAVSTGETAADTTTADDSTSSSSDTSDTATSGDLDDLVATPVDDSDSVSSGVDTSSETKTTDVELTELAEQLVELHGTYTNKDKVPFQNLKNLEPYVTKGMQSYLDSLIEGGTTNPNAPFFGRTTTALSTAILSQKGAEATALVTVKREDIAGTSASPKTTYAVLRLEFEQSGSDWLLDGLFELDLDEAQSS